MPNVSSSRGAKRKLALGVILEPQSKSSKSTFLSPNLILLEIPPDTNTSLPVWDAMRSQQADIAWTVNPYSVSVHFTPVTSTQGKNTNSTQSQSTPSATQSSAPSSAIPQPQMAIQSIPQLHGASQNTSVLLTLSQNSIQVVPTLPGQLIPQNPAASLIVSLPLIITQPQPALQPAKTPVIQTPPATPTKPQTLAKGPASSPFHTKSSSDVQICDDFLLGFCLAGKKCKMHHTPYPFHWQLRSVISHQWIDFPPHSQVLMEKMFCNVSREIVYIRDGHDRNSLSFETMEFDDQSKYDKVRRLANSDSHIRNPHFPSKWIFYWWNNQDWEEYNKKLYPMPCFRSFLFTEISLQDASALLLKSLSKKEPECTLTIGSQRYKVDFIDMQQTNVTTGFEREIRWRPAYRSLDSIQPHLQTGVQTDSTQPATDPPAANFSVDPLKEFSSWYPPVWCPSPEQDYSLVDVPAGTEAYRSVHSLFCESLPETRVDIISIQQVQNLLHWDKYQRHKAYMQKQHAKLREPLERHLFHGTSKEASEDICHNNLDPRLAGVNGTSHGFGTYFASTASFSHTFSSMAGPGKVRHMFLAKVLVGKVCLGRKNYHRPPPLSPKTKKFCLYDTCVDNVDEPTMFVVFDSCQCYPYYLIKYKDLPREVEI